MVSVVCGTICAVILSKDYGKDIPVTRASGIVPKAEMYLDEWPSKLQWVKNKGKHDK